MITLILVFLMILFIVGLEIDEDEGAFTFACLAVIPFIGIIIAGSMWFYDANILPHKIQMYQEENADIEKKIANTVEKYMQYEKEIMIEVSPEDDVITLVALYPELKADDLVKAEMNVYIENNKKIKEMKSKQLRIPIYKFMIFFGH